MHVLIIIMDKIMPPAQCACRCANTSTGQTMRVESVLGFWCVDDFDFHFSTEQNSTDELVSLFFLFGVCPARLVILVNFLHTYSNVQRINSVRVLPYLPTVPIRWHFFKI